MKSNKYDEADKEAVKAIRNEIRGQVQKTFASISTPPREIDVLQTEKRKLEHKMWTALSGEEKLEYIKLFKKVKDAEKKVKDSKISEEIDQNFTKSADEDLEKAAEEYGTRQGIELKPFATKFFKAGTNWKEKQMMKGAINGIVKPITDTFNTIVIGKGQDVINSYNEGDKVKLLIIKDNE